MELKFVERKEVGSQPIRHLEVLGEKEVLYCEGSKIKYGDVIEFKGHNRVVNSFQVGMAQGCKLLSCSNQLMIHDLAKGAIVRSYQFDNYQFEVSDVEWLNSEVVASCDEARSVSVFDLRQSVHKPVQQWQDAKDSLNCLKFKSGCLLITGSNDGNVYCYDLRKQLMSVDSLGDDPVTRMCDVGTGSHAGPAARHLIGLNVLHQGIFELDYTTGQATQFSKLANDTEYKLDVCWHDGLFISGSERGGLDLVSCLHPSRSFNFELNGEAGIVSSLALRDNRLYCGGAGVLNVFELL